jgi:hypothetical protein
MQTERLKIKPGSPVPAKDGPAGRVGPVLLNAADKYGFGLVIRRGILWSQNVSAEVTSGGSKSVPAASAAVLYAGQPVVRADALGQKPASQPDRLLRDAL